jgi:glycosyltransferase involved in cell wall biosynthesis
VKLAIIMPAFNAEKYIAAAVGSLLSQRDAAELDIIVVDDGSTDGTAAIVRQLAIAAPAIRLIEQEHRGISQARNRALDSLAADTEAAGFLDADDLSPEGRIASAMRAFATGEIDVHWGMTQRFADLGGGAEPVARPRPERGSQVGAVLMTVTTLQRAGRFDETLAMGEDVDFILRLLETQPRLELSSDVAVYYRKHAANVSRDVEAVRAGLSRAYLAAAHRRKNGSPAVPPGLFLPGERMSR